MNLVLQHERISKVAANEQVLPMVGKFTPLLVCRIAFVYSIPTTEVNDVSVVGAIYYS